MTKKAGEYRFRLSATVSNDMKVMETFSWRHFRELKKNKFVVFFLAFLCFHSLSNNFEKGQRGKGAKR